MNRYCLTLAAAAFAASASAPAAQTTLTLSGAEEPEQKAWTEPASIAFTSAKGSRDSWAINLAGRIEGQPAPSLPAKLFAKAVIQRNTQEKKEVENYNFASGLKFAWDNQDEGPDDANALYWFGDASAGFADKTIFPDPKAVCSGAVPAPPECFKQHETSWRAQLALQLHMLKWEDTFGYSDSTHTTLVGPAFAYSFSPVLTLFHDDLLDAKKDAAGNRPDGSISGAKLALSAAVSPEFTQYRLVLSAKYEHTQAFHRANLRKDKFQKDADLLKLSADYELGLRSFEAGRASWVPAFGVSYVKGDDPLGGKLDQDTVVVAFKVTYRN